MWSNRCASSSVVSATPPWMISTAGSARSAKILAVTSLVCGANSLGFPTTAFPRRNGRNHRKDKELERVIRRSNDTRHPERFTNDLRQAGLKGNWCRHLLRTSPRIEIGKHVVDVRKHKADLRCPCLEKGRTRDLDMPGRGRRVRSLRGCRCSRRARGPCPQNLVDSSKRRRARRG